MAHHPKKRNWYIAVASMLIVATLAVPLARIVLPPLHRNLSLNKLTNPDADTRAQGQSYLIRMADRDPKVLAGAIERLDGGDDRVFLELVVTLDQIGHWTKAEVPADAWLRWLAVVARDKDPEERVRVVQLLADLPEHAGDDRVIALFEAAIADADAFVRYNALVCVAEMRGAPAAKPVTASYDTMIQKLAADAKPMVARHALLFLGLLGQKKTIERNVRDENPGYLEALFWHVTVTGAVDGSTLGVSLFDKRIDPTTRAMAAYSLGLIGSIEARDALISLLDQGPRAITDDNQVAFWRAILALPLAPKPKPAPPDSLAPPPDPGYAALVRFLAKCNREDYENVSLRPLILACLFRDRRLLIDAAIKQSDIVTIADDPVAWLACIEGVPRAVAQSRGPYMKIAPPVAAHEQVRLAILRATAEPKPDDFLPLLASDEATVRDQACIIAAQRLSKDQVAGLVRRLLKPLDLKGDPFQPVFRYQDGAKYSAAILAGLTGVESNLLERMASDFADRTGVIEIVQLGLWMQGQPIAKVPDMRTKARQLLMRTDLPASTVLLALLHQRDPLALEHLLTPRGDQNPKLLTLLDEQRWWHVLEHFLPKDAPRLWVWADNDLARFQLDLLRNWHVLHRHELRGLSEPPR